MPPKPIIMKPRKRLERNRTLCNIFSNINGFIIQKIVDFLSLDSLMKFSLIEKNLKYYFEYSLGSTKLKYKHIFRLSNLFPSLHMRNTLKLLPEEVKNWLVFYQKMEKIEKNILKYVKNIILTLKKEINNVIFDKFAGYFSHLETVVLHNFVANYSIVSFLTELKYLKNLQFDNYIFDKSYIEDSMTPVLGKLINFSSTLIGIEEKKNLLKELAASGSALKSLHLDVKSNEERNFVFTHIIAFEINLKNYEFTFEEYIPQKFRLCHSLPIAKLKIYPKHTDDDRYFTEIISNCRNLRFLSYNTLKVMDLMNSWGKYLPNLSHLKFRNKYHQVNTSEIYEKYAIHCQKLKYLSIKDSSVNAEVSIVHFARCTNLRHLQLECFEIFDDECCRKIVFNNKYLKSLAIQIYFTFSLEEVKLFLNKCAYLRNYCFFMEEGTKIKELEKIEKSRNLEIFFPNYS